MIETFVFCYLLMFIVCKYCYLRIVTFKKIMQIKLFTTSVSVSLSLSLSLSVVIVPTLALFLASDWLILALLTSSKWMTSQRRVTTWGHHVGCLPTPAAADAV